jgi:deazaflavin-dependent oxidoreductase (nitroreductase family)
MARKRYSLFHSLNQQVAASPPGAWLFARVLHHFDRLFLRLSGQRVTMTHLVAGLPIGLVTTRGAKSGLMRTWPLIIVRDEQASSALALIGTNWGQRRYPAWYFNLKAHPQASCTFDGQTRQYEAHEATGDEYDRFWQAASDTYFGYPGYKQRIQGRHIPIMVLTPRSPG